MDKPDSPGWNEAEKKEVTKDNIMRTNKEIQPNDIEMILEEWKDNRKQLYADYYGDHFAVKSKTITYISEQEQGCQTDKMFSL